jgi:hypothetical protein
VKIETNLAVLALPDEVGLTPAARHLVLFLDEIVGERKDGHDIRETYESAHADPVWVDFTT